MDLTKKTTPTPTPTTFQASLLKENPLTEEDLTKAFAQEMFTPLLKPVGQRPAKQTYTPDQSIPSGAQEHLPLVRQIALKYGLRPDVLAGQVHQESMWNPRAKSPKGAMGLPQFTGQTVRELGRPNNPVIGKPYKFNPYIPKEAMEAMGMYMSWLLRRYKGDYNKALTAYNMGPYGFDQTGAKSKEAREYPSRVFYHAKKYGGGK